MIDLWSDLERWSREDKHEELGRFVARIRGNWWKIGLPLSQTLISENERKYLPIIFEKANLDPTDLPSLDIIPKILINYGQEYLNKRTQKILNPNSGDDKVFRDELR